MSSLSNPCSEFYLVSPHEMTLQTVTQTHSVVFSKFVTGIEKVFSAVYLHGSPQLQTFLRDGVHSLFEFYFPCHSHQL